MSDAPKKRPWFQYHLSTAVILMFVASALLWKDVHRELPGRGGETSAWTTVNGLAIRLSVSEQVVTERSPADFTIELRNDSGAPLAVFTSPNLWEHILLYTAGDARIDTRTTILADPAPPSVDWFTVLKPGESLRHSNTLPLAVRGGQVVLSEPCFDYPVGSGRHLARGSYFVSAFGQLRNAQGAWANADQALGARLWQGGIVSEPVTVFLVSPWTWREIAWDVAEAVVILGLFAFALEWLIRRQERRP